MGYNIRAFLTPKKSHLERSEKKSEENRLPQKWPFEAVFTPKNLVLPFLAILVIFCAIFSKLPLLPRFVHLWDESTIFLGEI